MRNLLFSLAIFFSSSLLWAQAQINTVPFQISHIATDSLFNSKQSIHIIAIPWPMPEDYSLDLVYVPDTLIRTSAMAEQHQALVAINAGFFDMRQGGSVTYLEIEDEVLSYSKDTEETRLQPNYLLNGALVFQKNDSIRIEKAIPDRKYENSQEEAHVLVTGPLLLQKGQATSLPDNAFSNNRHPRTCVCTLEGQLIWVVADGRSPQAYGLSLPELQEFLLSLGCEEAINLDGGGSTTFWLAEKGIQNRPSDRTGERPVSSIYIIRKKD